MAKVATLGSLATDPALLCGGGAMKLKRKTPSKLRCKVCMQTFICTTFEVKCREHVEAKHPKSDVVVCFPHLKK